MMRSRNATLALDRRVSPGKLIAGAALLAVSNWLAIDPPPPSLGGSYATLYAVVGPTGISLLFGCFAVAILIVGAMLSADRFSDGVGAAFDAEKVSIRRWFTRADVRWGDVEQVDFRVVTIKGRVIPMIGVRCRHRYAGPLGLARTCWLSGSRLADDADALRQWVERASEARASAGASTVSRASIVADVGGRHRFGRRIA